MSTEPSSRPAAQRDGGGPFEAPRGVKVATALASIVVSLALVGAVVLGITGEANGPLWASGPVPSARA
jgi:hypothetical protein